MSTLCPSNLLRATNVAFIIKPVKKKKKKDTSKSFKGQIRRGGFWGTRVNLTSRELTDLKVLLKIYGVWTGATVNSLAS